jgi:hypothetical protein
MTPTTKTTEYSSRAEWRRQQRVMQGKAKPARPTILRRSTARNLRYLETQGLIAPIDGRNLVIAPSSRRRSRSGVLIGQDMNPTGGV